MTHPSEYDSSRSRNIATGLFVLILIIIVVILVGSFTYNYLLPDPIPDLYGLLNSDTSYEKPRNSIGNASILSIQ